MSWATHGRRSQLADPGGTRRDEREVVVQNANGIRSCDLIPLEVAVGGRADDLCPA